MLLRPLRRQISVYKHFSGAGNVCTVYKYFSGAGKMFLNTSQASPALERHQISIYIEILPRRLKSNNIHLSGTKEAWKIFKNAFPAPEKYLYTLFRRRRS